MNMIEPYLQVDFVNTSKKEILESIDVREIIASQWFDLNYLSFDISKIDKLTMSQLLELTFIAKIIQNCESKLLLHYLLSKLKRPYSYNYKELYFDVFSDQWRELTNK